MFENGIPAELQAALWALLLAAVGYGARIAGKFFKLFEVKFDAWMDSKLSVEQRNLAHKFGQEAVAFAETAYKNLGGEEKLLKARDYIVEQLSSKGIKLTENELKAIIEKAVMEFNASKK